MRRFSLYRRGRVWYAQVFNPLTRKYLPGRPTGESDRRAAEHVSGDWWRDGIPEPGGKRSPPIDETFEVGTLLEGIRKAPLTPVDAEKIVRALKDQQLIETAVRVIAEFQAAYNRHSTPRPMAGVAQGRRQRAREPPLAPPAKAKAAGPGAPPLIGIPQEHPT